MPIEESLEGDVNSLTISLVERKSFKKGDLVVLRDDPTLTVCKVISVLTDEQGDVGYEVTDGKITRLVESGDQLGTVEEALTVGFIRYGADHPERGEVLTDELNSSPDITVHMGRRSNVLKKLFSVPLISRKGK